MTLSLVVACYFVTTLGELSGEEYKKQLINSLCSSRLGHLRFQTICTVQYFTQAYMINAPH